MNVLKKTAGFIFLTFLAVVLFASITHNPLSRLIASGGRCYEDDIVITSPDGEYSLIIKEWGFSFVTGAEIYALYDLPVNNFTKPFATKIGYTSGGDCCYSFRDSNYEIEWGNDSVTIRYYSGRKSETKDSSTWESVEFFLPDRNEKLDATGVSILIFVVGLLAVVFISIRKKGVNDH